MKKTLMVSSVVAIVAGIALVFGGVWGMFFTYNRIAEENIITPADASIPEVPVRGPWTLKAQADIIRTHTLRMTEGKTYAEMPRQIQKLNTDGSPMLDTQGEPIMVANTARDIWVTATTLITALNLAILGYALSGFAVLCGIVAGAVGVALCTLQKGR